MEIAKIGRMIHITHNIWYPVRMGGRSRQNDNNCIKAMAIHAEVKNANAWGSKTLQSAVAAIDRKKMLIKKYTKLEDISLEPCGMPCS
jgi:hypothetical protein